MEQTTERRGPGRPAKQAADTTPFHEHRMEQAAKERQKKELPVKESYYMWQLQKTYDPEKGRKLIHVKVTETGSTTEWVGWEKKIPVPFLKEIQEKGQLKG